MVDPTTQQAVAAMPREAPPLTNPPAVVDQADKARAALGGSPGVSRARARQRQADQAASGEWQPDIRKATGPVRTARFQPPEELEFEFTPPEPVEIRNNNIPLTIGLLFSIVAAFVVFVVSLAGSNTGPDPILTAFWRMLGALAVLITLSFAASWFMPSPPNRRHLLDQLEAEDRALGRYRAPTPDVSAATAQQEVLAGGLGNEEDDYDSFAQDDMFDADRGGSIDVTLDDDEDLFDNIDDFAAPTQDDDELYDEEDDLVATSPSSSAGAPFDGAEE